MTCFLCVQVHSQNEEPNTEVTEQEELLHVFTYDYMYCIFIAPSVYSAIAIAYESCTNICLLFSVYQAFTMLCIHQLAIMYPLTSGLFSSQNVHMVTQDI